MPRFSDARTWVTPSTAPTSSITDLSALYARVRGGLAASPRYGSERGYRVFWLERGVLRHRDLVAAEHGFAILGRHSRAHVRLLDDPTVALRHAILRAERKDDGGVCLRMTDLLAPIGTCIEGDPEPRFSFVAEGEVCARLGRHAFCAVPFDGCAPLPPEGGPGRAGPAAHLDADDIDDSEDGDDRDDPEASAGPAASHREVSEHVPRGRSGEERELLALHRTTIVPLLRPQHVESLPAPRGPLAARVTLLGDRGRLTLPLDAEQLERAVILGRYERCAAGSQVFSTHVSRMHVALRRVAGGVEAIDLASTQGLMVRGDVVHRVVVEDRADLILSESRDERVRIELVG